MACHRVRYTPATNLVSELVEAADGKMLTKTIARYGRVGLLCVDLRRLLSLSCVNKLAGSSCAARSNIGTGSAVVPRLRWAARHDRPSGHVSPSSSSGWSAPQSRLTSADDRPVALEPPGCVRVGGSGLVSVHSRARLAPYGRTGKLTATFPNPASAKPANSASSNRRNSSSLGEENLPIIAMANSRPGG